MMEFDTNIENHGNESTTRELLNSLALVIKTAQIHQIDNTAVINAIDKFISTLKILLQSDEVKIEIIGDYFYINNNRIRYTSEYIFNYDFLMRELKRIKLGTIIFHRGTGFEDMRALTVGLLDAGFSEKPFNTLTDALSNIDNIEILELRKVKEDETRLEKKEIIKRTYSSTVLLSKDVFNKLKAGERTNLKKAKRVIGTVVDQIIEDETMLIGMTTIKDYDEYTYYHSVNVSILSVALGHRIGLPKKTLSRLGLAALFHDIGKIDIPLEVLNKPTDFTEEEWKIVKEHPQNGATLLLKLRNIDELSVSLIIPAFEHHLNYDLTGYPSITRKLELDLFSRIIAIADQYDAMTSARVYSRIPMSPEMALSTMMERSGKQLDPTLLKVFINMVGVYPIGSLVMLDTNELGLVFENNPNPEFIDRPRVLLIIDASGERIKDTVVDLMERNEDGNFKRTITKTLDPNKYGINLAEYIL
jgi:HD-GYP domain-containing protein (c-di-GMP phosphodiesterase class II)